MASAILSFNASATDTYVTYTYYNAFPLSGSSYLTLSSPPCNTPAAITGYVFQDAGCAWNLNSYQHTGKWCYASNQSTCPNNYYRQDGTKVTQQCLSGMTLAIENNQVKCVNPCADSGGQTFDKTGYFGDTSTTAGATPTAFPEYICQGQCRAHIMDTGECYTRAYLPTSPKFGQSAIFCTASYITLPQICVKSDDPNNPPPANSPTDPTDPNTPVPSAPPTGPAGDDPGAPSAEDGPPAGAPTNCPAGTYAAKSGNGWICNGIDNPAPKPDDQGCPGGSVMGTVNGVEVCAKGSSGKPSGSSPGSGTAGATGADGVGGTGSGNASAGTVGATADTGGSVGGPSTTGNENAPGKTSLGVDCSTPPPECTGDPLLCAIQQQEWQSGCDVQKAIASPLPDDELAKWEAVGTDKFDSAEITGAQGRVDQYLSQFAQRLSFSTGGCPGDFSINVMGRSIHIAISDACPLLRIMKIICWMGAYLFSLRVLWSSVL